MKMCCSHNACCGQVSTTGPEGIVGTRFFEVLASGTTLLLCNRVNETSLWEDGVHLVMFDGMEDMLRKVLSTRLIRALSCRSRLDLFCLGYLPIASRGAPLSEPRGGEACDRHRRPHPGPRAAHVGCPCKVRYRREKGISRLTWCRCDAEEGVCTVQRERWLATDLCQLGF